MTDIFDTFPLHNNKQNFNIVNSCHNQEWTLRVKRRVTFQIFYFSRKQYYQTLHKKTLTIGNDAFLYKINLINGHCLIDQRIEKDGVCSFHFLSVDVRSLFIFEWGNSVLHRSEFWHQVRRSFLIKTIYLFGSFD